MSSDQNSEELLEAIRKMLWEDWDPIGVNEFPEAIDEYDGYVLEVAELVRSKASHDDLFKHLWGLETEHIGLRGDRENTLRFVEKLVELSANYNSSN